MASRKSFVGRWIVAVAGAAVGGMAWGGGTNCTGCSNCDAHTWQGGGGGCGSASGTFGTSQNWSGFLSPPNQGDVALFDLPCTYTVSFGANHTICRAFTYDGAITFDLNGYIWTVNGTTAPAFRIGEDSSGASVTVIDGDVVAESMEVAYASSPFILDDGTATLAVGADGTVTVDGALSVGAGANPGNGGGTLSITSNGEVVADSVAIANGHDGSAIVSGSSARLESANDITISITGSAAAGVLELSGGGTAEAGGAIRLRRSSSTVRGVGTLDTPLVKNGDSGKIQVAAASVSGSTGFLDITGDYEQTTEFMDSTAGTLEIDVKGATAGTNFDQLRIDGDATLAGTLVLTRDSSYLPCAGTPFAFLTASTRTGTFGTVTISSGSGFSDCRNWRIVYCADRAVALVDTILGDADFDGDVDDDDVAKVSANINATGCMPPGDVDFSGTTTFGDLNIVLTEKGNSCSLSTCP